MLTYIKTSAPNSFSGSAMSRPRRFADNAYGDAAPQLIFDSVLPPPVEVGLISADEVEPQTGTIQKDTIAANDPTVDDIDLAEAAQNGQDITIADNAIDADTEPVTTDAIPTDVISTDAIPTDVVIEPTETDSTFPFAETSITDDGVGHGFGYYGNGVMMRSPILPNAVTIIPVGAGLAAQNGLIAEDIPIYMEGGVLPEAEIDNAFDDSVPALLVPVEDVVVSDDGRLALMKKGGAIRAFGYRTGDGNIIYGDGLGSLFKKIVNGAKNAVIKVGKKIVPIAKKVGNKVVKLGKNVVNTGVKVGKQVLNKGVQLAKTGIQKGVQVIKNVGPQLLGSVAQSAASSAMDHISNAVQGDEEEYVGSGYYGAAIYARGLYGSAIIARGYTGGSTVEYNLDTADPVTEAIIPVPAVVAEPDVPPVTKMVVATEQPIGKDHRKVRSVVDGARPRSYGAVYRDAPYARHNSTPVPQRRRFGITLPEGFHFPNSKTIQRLIYIGVFILSLVLSALGTNSIINWRENQLASMRDQVKYEHRPWDNPVVQERLRDYLGEKRYNAATDAWLFPSQQDYVVFPADYDLDPDDQRYLKRIDLDRMYEATYQQALKDNQYGPYHEVNFNDIRKTIDGIPGLDNITQMKALAGPAFNSVQRGKFRLKYYDRKPASIDDID